MCSVNERIMNLDINSISGFNKIDKFKRQQSISFELLFPKKRDGFCDCGCGKPLEGKRTRYSTEECSKFAQGVWGVLCGHTQTLDLFLNIKFKHWACCRCDIMDKYKVYKNGLVVNAIQKDHIIPVHKGGGGCWLDNYQLLCDDCHKEKTKKDML